MLRFLLDWILTPCWMTLTCRLFISLLHNPCNEDNMVQSFGFIALHIKPIFNWHCIFVWFFQIHISLWHKAVYITSLKKIINDGEMASCLWEIRWTKNDKVQRGGTFKQWNCKERTISNSKLKQWLLHRNVQRLKTSKRSTLHCLKGSIACSLKCQSCFPCGSNLLDRKVYLNKGSGKSSGEGELSYSKSLNIPVMLKMQMND